MRALSTLFRVSRRTLPSLVGALLVVVAVHAQQSGGGGSSSPITGQWLSTQTVGVAVNSSNGNGPANATFAIGNTNSGIYFNNQGGNDRLEFEIDGTTVMAMSSNNLHFGINSGIQFSQDHNPFGTVHGQFGIDDDGASSYALEEGFSLAGNPQHRFYTVPNSSDSANYERIVVKGVAGETKLVNESGGNGSAAMDIGLYPLGTGSLKYGKALIALGGGATPTFGTIGGSGPATAAQNTWMQMKDSSGASFWIPVWK